MPAYVPETNILTVNSAVCYSLPALSCDFQAHVRKLLSVLPEHSTKLVFTLVLFHADPAVLQYPFKPVLMA